MRLRIPASLNLIVRCVVRSLFLSFLLLTSSTAWCKCITIYYTISGRVLTTAGKPLSDVGLVVEWSQLDRTERVATVSARDGTYKVEVPFYAYSGASSTTREDLCHAVLSEVRVSALRGDGTKQKTVRISGKKTSVDWVFD